MIPRSHLKYGLHEACIDMLMMCSCLSFGLVRRFVIKGFEML